MAEEIKEGVKTEDKTAPIVQEEDTLAIIKAQDVKISKLEEERENYRKGMLKAKGKLPEEGGMDQVEMMRQIAREEYLNTEIAHARQDKDFIIEKQAKELREAKLALANKSGIGSGGTGASTEDKMTVKDNILTDAQISDFKAKGWDDAKIERFKKNLQKGR